MPAVPEGLAGALPQTRGDPDQNNQLAEQKCGDVRFWFEAEHPKRQTQADKYPSDDADANIEPKQREKIMPEQTESATQSFVHALFVVGDGNHLRHVKPNANYDQQK